MNRSSCSVYVCTHHNSLLLNGSHPGFVLVQLLLHAQSRGRIQQGDLTVSTNMASDMTFTLPMVSLLSALEVFTYLVPLNQQGLEPGDFSPQLPDQPDVGVLVDGGFVDDVLGPVGVAQSAQRLAVVHVGGGDGCGGDKRSNAGRQHAAPSPTQMHGWCRHSLAIMMVLALPPRLSFSSHVNTESL